MIAFWIVLVLVIFEVASSVWVTVGLRGHLPVDSRVDRKQVLTHTAILVALGGVFLAVGLVPAAILTLIYAPVRVAMGVVVVRLLKRSPLQEP
jgi:hypothetical protein